MSVQRGGRAGRRKVLIYEHICAGGAGGKGASLMAEGAGMLRAAMRDFSEVADPFTIIHPSYESLWGTLAGAWTVTEDWRGAFTESLEKADAALIIAPESEGQLASLTSMAEFRGVRNLGCQTSAVELAGDKLQFAARMEELGIPHPNTLKACCFFDSSARAMGRWVTKPVDGAGCGGIRIFKQGTACALPANGSVMVQEYIDGEAMSASVIAGEGGPRIVSINRQFIRQAGDTLVYTGGEVTGLEPNPAIVDLVERIWRGIPGLMGYWGVDYLDTPSGPVVIEVNPRLTTSYCALGAAIGANPAELILSAAEGWPLDGAVRRGNIRFDKNGEHVS